MKALVTGGSGFLGQRLIARLKQEGHEVTALSRSLKSDARLKALGATTISSISSRCRDATIWPNRNANRVTNPFGHSSRA